MRLDVLRSVLVSVAALGGAGCFSSGPYFRPTAVFPAGPEYQLLLEQVWAGYTFGAPPLESERVYFAAPGSVAPKGIRVAPGSARRLGDDGPADDSSLRPINGTELWLQIETDHVDTSLWVSDTQHHSRNEVVSFFTQDAHNDASAYAVTGSGRYALVVRPNATALWDLVTRRSTKLSDDPTLAELRRTLATRRGYPGDWWMTDDTRYVVIAPAIGIHVQGGESGSPDPMIATVGPLKLDLNRQGIIYDRQAHAARPFALELYSGDKRYRICGVCPVGDKPLLLYKSQHELVVLDEQINVLAGRDFELPDAELSPPVWDASGNQLIMLGRIGLLHIHTIGESPSIAEYDRPPVYFVLEWNWRSGAIRQLPFTTSDIRSAITGTPENQSKR